MCSCEDEMKDLRTRIDDQNEIIDSQNQQIYEAKQKLDRLEKMELEFGIEIEALHGIRLIKEGLEEKVKILEADLNSEKQKFNSLQEDFTNEQEAHLKIVEDFTSKIEELKKIENKDEFSEEKDALITKISLLQENEAIMSQCNFELQTEKKNALEKVVLFELALNEKNREFEEIKNVLVSKTSDLQSALNQVQELQDEKAVLTSELSMLKTVPASQDKRGNSIFAEVDDNRKRVTKNLEAYKKKYMEIKKTLFKKNSEMRALEVENVELKKKFDQNEQAPFEALAKLNETYQKRIDDLMHQVSILSKRPESPQIISLSETTSSNYQTIKNLVEYERKQNRELTHEMDIRSQREAALGEENFQLKNKVRSLINKSMKDSAQITELNVKLETISTQLKHQNNENLPKINSRH